MSGVIHSYLAEDHARLDALLARSVADPARIDPRAYDEFRGGLLRHIAMEEKVLLPFARERRGGEPLPIAPQLRADHAALAGLLVPTPTHAIVAAIRGILEAHNRIEEQPDGLYDACEHLAGSAAGDVVLCLRAVPEVPVAPHCDEPHVHQHLARVLARANRGLGD